MCVCVYVCKTNVLWFHAGGIDYVSGPYSVTIKEGDTHAEFCIDI